MNWLQDNPSVVPVPYRFHPAATLLRPLPLALHLPPRGSPGRLPSPAGKSGWNGGARLLLVSIDGMNFDVMPEPQGGHLVAPGAWSHAGLCRLFAVMADSEVAVSVRGANAGAMAMIDRRNSDDQGVYPVVEKMNNIYL